MERVTRRAFSCSCPPIFLGADQHFRWSARLHSSRFGGENRATLEKPEATQRPSAPQAVFMPAGGQPDTLVRPTTAEKVVETRKGLAS